MKAELVTIIKSKTRDQWAATMEGSDACLGPVLSMLEAPEHHHMRARNTSSRSMELCKPLQHRDSRAPIHKYAAEAGRLVPMGRPCSWLPVWRPTKSRSYGVTEC